MFAIRKPAAFAVVVFATATVALGSLVGCPSTQAARHVLQPSAVRAWDNGVRADTERGIEDAFAQKEILGIGVELLSATVEHVDTVLRSDYSAAAFASLDWPSLQPYAARGIDVRLREGEIGPVGAEVFRDRVNTFTEALDVLGGAR